MLKRCTSQKRIIFETVNELHNHPTAEMVYEAVNKKNSIISKSTVYRNLNEMASDNLIKRVEIPNGCDIYDFNNENHYHFYCEKCKNVSDIDVEYNIKYDQLNVEHTIIKHDILFRGICNKCN